MTHTSAIETFEKAHPASASQHSHVELAFRDIAAGIQRWELWGTLGWHDIRQRYRRSTLGPFWITLSMGLMILGLSVLWSTLFKQPVAEYLPYFAVGFIVWTLISSMISEGCTVFSGAESIIKQVPVPLSIHIYRVVWRNIIIAAHNLSIYAVLMLVSKIWPGWGLLGAAFGVLLLAINGAAAGFIVGILSARYRDIPPFVASLLQMLFFFSPILWRPESLPDRNYLVTYNPFYYFIEVVRGPLLGTIPIASVWWTVLAMTICSCAAALALFIRFRRRIAYWV